MPIQKPKIAKVLEELDLSQELEEEMSIEKKKVSNQVLENPTVMQIDFDECSLNKMIFLNKKVHLSFMDCILTDSDLSNLSFQLNSIVRCQFIDCKFVGIDFSDSTIQNVIFKNCDFTLANFSTTKFQNICFQDCLWKDVRILECHYKNVEFQNCILENLENIHTSLRNIDISSSTLLGGKWNLEDIRGAIINSQQASAFIQFLGVVIKDEQ